MSAQPLSRRNMLSRGVAACAALLLGGCDRLSRSPRFQKILDSAEELTYRTQRLFVSRTALAHEFTETDLSPVFRSNGTSMPQTPQYQSLLAGGFVDWRLDVAGLVGRPVQLSLQDLHRLPARTQITRHDCVEGWSAIGKWTGVPLHVVLQMAQLRSAARYIVFYCADELEPGQPYYESIDLIDAFHPQTILAYALNDKQLPVANGAPLRLRLERQLGYKHAKFLMRIEAVERLDDIRGGKGGFWEDRGYEWYAGI